MAYISCIQKSFYYWFILFCFGGAQSQDQVGITVFIHGTIASELQICNPIHCYAGTGDDTTLSWRLTQRCRNHPLTKQDQLLLDEGLIEVPHRDITSFRERKSAEIDTGLASYPIIAAYDAVAMHIAYGGDNERYLLYGWNGLLSNNARKKAGYAFYDQLIDYVERVRDETGIDPLVRIVTHSHGGNVALYLAKAEEEKQRRLSVDVLCMLGAPIQIETADYIASSVFKTLLSVYSSGDIVQGNDYFSTRMRKSYQRMSDLVDLHNIVSASSGLVRRDMQVRINNNASAVNHVNMWLIGRAREIGNAMGPLPFVVCVPALLMHAHNKQACVDATAHFNQGHGYCFGYTTCNYAEEDGLINVSPNFNKPLLYASKNTHDVWRPDDRFHRNLVFNYKNVLTIKHAFGAL